MWQIVEYRFNYADYRDVTRCRIVVDGVKDCGAAFNLCKLFNETLVTGVGIMWLVCLREEKQC